MKKIVYNPVCQHLKINPEVVDWQNLESANGMI